MKKNDKKGIAINILTWIAGANMGLVIIFFIINAVKMGHLQVNSDQWFERYGLMIKYIGWGCCSHIPLLIASYVNTSRYKKAF